MSFDPYYEWLGIPPEERPTHYYRLLGIELFETSPTVISNAADRVMLHIRTFQNGPNAAHSQKLLNEVSAARICLLNADKKTAYDASLRAKLGDTAAPPAVVPVSPPSTLKSGPGGAPPVRVRRTAPARPEQRARRPHTWGVSIAATVVIGLAVVLALVVLDKFGTQDATTGAERSEASRSGYLSSSEQAIKAPPLPVVDAPSVPEQNTTDPTRESSTGEHTEQPPVDASERIEAEPAKTGDEMTPAGTSAATDAAAPRDPSHTAGVPPPPAVDPKPPTVVNNDPFLRLPKEVDLAWNDAGDEAVAVRIGTIVGPIDPAWQVSIDSGATDLATARFRAGQASAGAEEVGWPIRWERVGTGASDNSPPPSGSQTAGPVVATLVASGNTLGLRAEASTTGTPLSQLRNCILSLSNGSQTHEIQLRPAVRQVAMPLGFENSQEIVEVSLPVPLAEDRLMLILAKTISLPTSFLVEPSAQTAGVNETMRIQLRQWDGAEISLRLLSDGDALRVVTTPTYTLGRKRSSLTVEQVDKELTRLARQRQITQRDGNAAAQRLKAIPDEAKRIRSLSASTPQERSMQSLALSRLQSESKKLQSRIRRLQSAVPKLDETIKSLTGFKEAITTLEGKATIPFRVVATTDSGQLTLLVVE